MDYLGPGQVDEFLVVEIKLQVSVWPRTIYALVCK